MGKLKNGNPDGDPSRAPRCGARARRTGKPCQAPAMKNGRCRLHGGLSTGPRTPEGKARARRGNWKHGEYSTEAMRLKREAAEVFRRARLWIAEASGVPKTRRVSP